MWRYFKLLFLEDQKYFTIIERLNFDIGFISFSPFSFNILMVLDPLR